MRKRFLFLIFAFIFLSQFLSGLSFWLLVGVCLFVSLFMRVGWWIIVLAIFIIRLVYFDALFQLAPGFSKEVRAAVCNFVSESNYTYSVHICELDSSHKYLLRYLPPVDLEFAKVYDFLISCQLLEGDISNYFRIFNIYYACDLISVRDVSHKFWYWDWMNKISFVRLFMYKKIEQSFHYPASDLLSGLLFGYRANFDLLTKHALNYLGLTHLIAISGYKVALFLLLVDKLLFFINRFHRLYLYPLFLLVFIVLTGFQSSVIRACVMAQIQLLALKNQTSYENLDSLFVCVLVMFLWSPARIYFDVGFWLSVCSTLGIILFANYFLKFFARYFSNALVQESLAMSCISMFSTMIISVVFFQQFNLFAILINIIVAPLIPVLMFGAFHFVINQNLLLDYVYVFLLSLFVDVYFWIVDVILEVNLILLELFHDFFTFMT